MSESREMAEKEMPFSVKIEHTSKGIRCTVHVYAGDPMTASDQAVALLKTTEAKAKDEGFTIAPDEQPRSGGA